MSETRKHYNEHREGKIAFQAMLTPEEKELLEIVKKLRAIPKNKSLLITLLNEEKARLLKQ
jgi:hypothetical protein